jgi:hypothetical protein
MRNLLLLAALTLPFILLAKNAAVDLFHTKVLADDCVKHYFKDINMTRKGKKSERVSQLRADVLNRPKPSN